MDEEAQPIEGVVGHPFIYVSEEVLLKAAGVHESVSTELSTQFINTWDYCPFVQMGFAFGIREDKTTAYEGPGVQFCWEKYITGDITRSVNGNQSCAVLRSPIDEYPVFIFTCKGDRLHEHTNSQYFMQCCVLTNHGNIIASEIGRGRTEIVKKKYEVALNTWGGWHARCTGGRSQWNDGCAVDTYDNGYGGTFIQKELRPRQCTVPKFIVELLSTFLSTSKRTTSNDKLTQLNTKFKTLCTHYNNLTQKAASVETLTQQLDEAKCEIERLKKINQFMEWKLNPTSSLDISSIGLDDNGLKIFIEELKYNTTLWSLYVTGNNITTNVIPCILDLFRFNTTLCGLSIDFVDAVSNRIEPFMNELTGFIRRNRLRL